MKQIPKVCRLNQKNEKYSKLDCLFEPNNIITKIFETNPQHIGTTENKLVEIWLKEGIIEEPQ